MPSREEARRKLAERISTAFTHAVDNVSNPLEEDQKREIYAETFQRIKTALDEDVAMTVPFAASERQGALLRESQEAQFESVVRLAEVSKQVEPDGSKEGETQLIPKWFHKTKYEILHDGPSTILLRLPEAETLEPGACLMLDDGTFILEQLPNAPHLYRVRQLDLVGVLTFFIGLERDPESHSIRIKT